MLWGLRFERLTFAWLVITRFYKFLKMSNHHLTVGLTDSNRAS